MCIYLLILNRKGRKKKILVIKFFISQCCCVLDLNLENFFFNSTTLNINFLWSKLYFISIFIFQNFHKYLIYFLANWMVFPILILLPKMIEHGQHNHNEWSSKGKTVISIEQVANRLPTLPAINCFVASAPSPFQIQLNTSVTILKVAFLISSNLLDRFAGC